MAKATILLQVTGSISCYKACQLTSLLVKDGYEVLVSMSQGALKFLQPPVFAGLTKNDVFTPDMFNLPSDPIPHINLAQKVDAILVYPASANCITRLAAGLSDDLFGATCLANNFQKPLLIAPAMNSNMFAHPAVQEALKKLEGWGAHILPTAEGRLACGVVGKGKLIEAEEAKELLEKVLSSSKKGEN